LNTEITSISIKFYHGCIFHDGRKTFGKFRRKGDSIGEDLCEECYGKASGSAEFLAHFEVAKVEERF